MAPTHSCSNSPPRPAAGSQKRSVLSGARSTSPNRPSHSPLSSTARDGAHPEDDSFAPVRRDNANCLEATRRQPRVRPQRPPRPRVGHPRRHSRPSQHRRTRSRARREARRARCRQTRRRGRRVGPTFHSLRHSHGSALIAAGWDIEEVSARLGHANVATTQPIYVHAYDAARRSSARRGRLAGMYGDVEANVEALTRRSGQHDANLNGANMLQIVAIRDVVQ